MAVGVAEKYLLKILVLNVDERFLHYKCAKNSSFKLLTQFFRSAWDLSVATRWWNHPRRAPSLNWSLKRVEHQAVYRNRLFPSLFLHVSIKGSFKQPLAEITCSIVPLRSFARLLHTFSQVLQLRGALGEPARSTTTRKSSLGHYASVISLESLDAM